MGLEKVDPDRFDTLIEINALINSDFSDSRAVLYRIIDSAMRLTEGDAASLLLVNPEDRKSVV